MATSHSPWFKFSFFMRSNEDTMVALLKESFTERQNKYPHQFIPWSSQVLPKEYTIGWWTINQTKQDRFLLPSILFQDHYIFRYKLNLEQNFLFSQLKSGLYELANKGGDNKLFLANAQYYLSEGYINTYIRHIRRALLKLQGKYISSSLVGQRPAAKASANQEHARDLSQEGMYYGIQMPHTFRSFLRGKFFQKLLSASVRWISFCVHTPIACISILPYASSSNALLLILHHLLLGTEMERVKRTISDLVHLHGARGRAKKHSQGDLESQPLKISGPIIESPAPSLSRSFEHGLLIPAREREYNAAVRTIPSNDNRSPFRPINPLQMCAPLVRSHAHSPNISCF